MTIYDRIKTLRKSLNMTQDELAKIMGYNDRSMIAKIESGAVDISQSKILAFAQALYTTPAYLMGWTEETDIKTSYELTTDEQYIVDSYRKLNQTGKEYITQTITISLKMYEEPITFNEEE